MTNLAHRIKYLSWMVVALIVTIVFSSCRTTKYVPDNQFFIVEVENFHRQ